MAWNGDFRTLMRTFLTAVQIASLKSNCLSVSVPVIGTLTWMFPSPSLISATMSPSGSPIRFLTSSEAREGATLRLPTRMSFLASSLSCSILYSSFAVRSPRRMIHASRLSM